MFAYVQWVLKQNQWNLTIAFWTLQTKERFSD